MNKAAVYAFFGGVATLLLMIGLSHVFGIDSSLEIIAIGALIGAIIGLAEVVGDVGTDLSHNINQQTADIEEAMDEWPRVEHTNC